MYGPMVVRESAPITTPPSKATAIIDVCKCERDRKRARATYAKIDLALLQLCDVHSVYSRHHRSTFVSDRRRRQRTNSHSDRPRD